VIGAFAIGVGLVYLGGKIRGFEESEAFHAAFWRLHQIEEH
jgi:hypothetical protein